VLDGLEVPMLAVTQGGCLLLGRCPELSELFLQVQETSAQLLWSRAQITWQGLRHAQEEVVMYD
jgi:hypothetical protein